MNCYFNYCRLLCSDMVYVLLFPQLLLVVHAESKCNKYGCIASFCVGLILRLLSIRFAVTNDISSYVHVFFPLGGEELLGLPVLIQFPFYDRGQQLFPFRTLIMLISLFVHLSVSNITEKLFTRGILDRRFDWLHCYQTPLEIDYFAQATVDGVQLRSLAKSPSVPLWAYNITFVMICAICCCCGKRSKNFHTLNVFCALYRRFSGS